MRMILVAATLLLGACGGDDTAPAPADMRVAADIASFCGHPGDKGNSLGVGKYCQSPVTDCAGNGKATFCSTLGSSNTFFCTFVCTPPTDDMGSTECGENASCVCGSGGGQSGCGCYPSSCK